MVANVAITHSFVSGQADGTDTSVIRPSDWNKKHQIMVPGQSLIGRGQTANGAAQIVTLGTNLTLSNTNVLSASGGVSIPTVLAPNTAGFMKDLYYTFSPAPTKTFYVAETVIANSTGALLNKNVSTHLIYAENSTANSYVNFSSLGSFFGPLKYQDESHTLILARKENTGNVILNNLNSDLKGNYSGTTYVSSIVMRQVDATVNVQGYNLQGNGYNYTLKSFKGADVFIKTTYYLDDGSGAQLVYPYTNCSVLTALYTQTANVAYIVIEPRHSKSINTPDYIKCDFNSTSANSTFTISINYDYGTYDWPVESSTFIELDPYGQNRKILISLGDIAKYYFNTLDWRFISIKKLFDVEYRIKPYVASTGWSEAYETTGFMQTMIFATEVTTNQFIPDPTAYRIICYSNNLDSANSAYRVLKTGSKINPNQQATFEYNWNDGNAGNVCRFDTSVIRTQANTTPTRIKLRNLGDILTLQYDATISKWKIIYATAGVVT